MRCTRSVSKAQNAAKTAPSKVEKCGLPPARTTHRMTTRARAKHFRILELPPELRNNIYGLTMQVEGDISLLAIKLPSLLRVNRQIFQEATPLFFATNTFTATVRSNWCVRHAHWHNAEHVHYSRTGILNPYAGPTSSTDTGTLSQEARFLKVKLRIDCCCCHSGVQVAEVTLRCQRSKPTIEKQLTRKATDLATKNGMGRIFEAVDRAVAKIERVGPFRGWRMRDQEVVARCFCFAEAARRTSVEGEHSGKDEDDFP